MSAIAGARYYDDRPVAPELLDALAFRNDERGPHHHSRHVAPGIACLHFAHHFDDLAARETQPAETEGGTIITWDGRLDNRDDLILQLGLSRAPVVVTDVQIVSSAFAKWDLDALPRLIGDWSLAAWRPYDKTLCLARDFAGTRPLHYCCTSEGVFWSTCLETLVAGLDLYADIDEVFLTRLLTSELDPELTPYKGCRSVLSGHVVTFHAGEAPRSRRHWDFPVSTLRYRDPEAYQEHLRHVFQEAVAVRLRGATPYWCELSGGLDSTAVLSMADYLCRKSSATSVRPASFTYPDSPESDESEWIDCVEEFLTLESLRIPCSVAVDPAIYNVGIRPLNADPWIRHLNDAVRGSGGFLVLTGALGDLVLAKNSANLVSAFEHLEAGAPGRLWSAAWHWSRRRRVPVWHVLMDVFSMAYSRESRPWFESAGVKRAKAGKGKTAAQRARDSVLTDRYFETVADHAPAAIDVSRYPRTKRHLAQGLYRLTAGHRLESPDDLPNIRFAHPFAHRPFTEFVLSIPQHVLWDPGLSRSLMRRSFSGFMPPAVVRRHDKGYAAPFVKRLALNLARALMADSRGMLVVEQGVVDLHRLQRYVEAARTDHGVDTTLILNVASTELWLRQRASTPKKFHQSTCSPSS